jgi:hypothetical protein
MKLYLLFIFLAAGLQGCSGNRNKQEYHKLFEDIPMVSEEEYSSFDNPALIYGTSIGEIVQQFYKQGQWSELIKFISSSSIKEFGEENIIQSFQRSDFGYKIKLKSMSIYGEGRYYLNYQTLKYGTIGVLRMEVLVENDTAKIVLKQITPYIQFDKSNGTEKNYCGC